MALQAELESQFESLNVKVTTNILTRCEQLCQKHNMEVEDFVDQWLAFAASTGTKLAPTIDNLDIIERNFLKSCPLNTTDNETEQMEVDTIPETPIQIKESIKAEIPKSDFHNRNNSGTILQSFGEPFQESYKQDSCDIKILNDEKCTILYETFLARFGAISNMSRLIIDDILKENILEIESSDKMIFSGRICSKNRKLDLNNAFLEGHPQLHNGLKLKLNLNEVGKLRLFNGESVVIVGNRVKDFLNVKEIKTGCVLAPSIIEKPSENLKIVVAAGPFTMQENLKYEPLETLLTKIVHTKPNLVILMGPFLDQTNVELEVLTEPFDNFFENVVQGIMGKLKGLDVQIVLVPSQDDVHNYMTFPTLPYRLKSQEGLVQAPNPFLLDLDGIVIGGSNADILFHLSKFEASRGLFEDRIGHLIQHLFNQKNFYPLNPAEMKMSMDFQMLEKVAVWGSVPNILILPSNLRHFVKIIKNCVVINPERLLKQNSPGSFATIEIRGTVSDKELHQRVSCIIEKI